MRFEMTELWFEFGKRVGSECYLPTANYFNCSLETRVSVLLLFGLVMAFRIVSATYSLWVSVNSDPEGRQRPWLNRDSETPLV